MASAKDDVRLATPHYLCVDQLIPFLQDILGHSDNFRRTWDTAKYEKLAKDRLKKDKEGGKFTAPTPMT